MKESLSAKKALLIISSALLLGLLIGAFVLPNHAKAAEATKELKIKTSAQCEMCQDRIQTKMSKVTGVNKAVLDLNDKVLTVNYDPGKITPDEVRKAVTNIGYSADNLPSDPKAYKKLPKCCKLPKDRK